MRRLVYFLFLLSIVLLPSEMQAKKYGSNRTSSRQKKVFISSKDDENEFDGFSSFEGGIVLGRGAKKGRLKLNNLFPFQGDITLNGGTLSLKKDVVIQDPVNVGVGTIEAENENSPKNIEFPAESLIFDLPAEGFEKALKLVDQKVVKSSRAIPVGGSVNSVDWSYDDAYVAVAVESDIGVNELQIYWFHDDILTLTASVDYGSSDAQAVRWHPSQYYLASGKTSNDELEIYSFSPLTGLSLQSSSNVPGSVSALSWDPNGDHIAVGMQSLSAAVRVYDVDGSGNIGGFVSYSFGLVRSVQPNALDFDTLGQFIVVGLNVDLLDPEIYVLEFTGAALNLSASLEIGQTVSGASWIPDEQIFTIGLTGGTERLQTLQFNELPGTITDIPNLLLGQTLTVNDLQWGPESTHLCIGTDENASGQELEVYFYNRSKNELQLVSGFEVSTDVLSLRWSQEGNHLAVGDVDGDLHIYNFAEDIITFKNIRLSFNSNTRFRSPIRFEGTCVVNGGGNNIELLETASIIVANSGRLHLENATVKGIKDTNVSVLDQDGRLAIRDVIWLQDSYYTFTQGSMSLSGKVQMSGDHIFAYQSMMTSTLQSKSTWKLDTGFTFSYDPLFTSTLDPSVFEMVDKSAILKLDNACIHDERAWKLTKGTLLVGRNVELAGEQTSGTVFGSDGGDDLLVEFLPGAKFHLTQGILNNKNQELNAWAFQTSTSQFIVESNARLNIYNSVNVSPGFIVFERNARFGHKQNAKILGATEPRGAFFQFNLGS